MPDLQRLVRSLPEKPLGPLGQIGVAGACTAVAALIHLLFESVLQGAPFITFFPSALVASVLAGARAGVLALLLGAVTAVYFWLEPYRAFDLTTDSAVTLLVFLVMGGIVVLGAHLLKVAVAMARESEARASLIAREMQHRIGNKLALVQALARLSARHARTLDEFQELFSERLRALSESQAVVGQTPDLPIDLGALLTQVLRPFDERRIVLSGQRVGIDNRDRPMLALLMYELGTNAVKHGALSTPTGRVRLDWALQDDGIRIDWRESGGPHVEVPERKGFGTSLANAAFPPERGAVTLDYEPSGLRCVIRLHAAMPMEAARPVATPFAAPAPSTGG